MNNTIDQATLHKIINNVVMILDIMQHILKDIKDRDSTHDYYLRHMFCALIISTSVIFGT